MNTCMRYYTYIYVLSHVFVILVTHLIFNIVNRKKRAHSSKSFEIAASQTLSLVYGPDVHVVERLLRTLASIFLAQLIHLQPHSFSVPRHVKRVISTQHAVTGMSSGNLLSNVSVFLL